MRISFDLDDTLICYQAEAAYEPRLPWYKRLLAGNEPMRRDTRKLMRRLHESGWELWIYTTSYRSPSKVRRWLRCHGIKVADVVNQSIHDRRLKRSPNDHPPSKHPAAFGIDLHVDDSVGVRMEGDSHGFDVVVVSPDDNDWTEKVWLAAQRVQRRRGGPPLPKGL